MRWSDSIRGVVIVAFHRGNELDLGVGGPGSRAAVSDLVPEQEGEGLPEGLLEGGSHEAVDYRVDGRVGVGHAVGPRLYLVRGVVRLVVRMERLEEDEDLDGTPANGEKEDDHHHHLGDFAPDTDGSLGQKVDLRGRGRWADLIIGLGSFVQPACIIAQAVKKMPQPDTSCKTRTIELKEIVSNWFIITRDTWTSHTVILSNKAAFKDIFKDYILK